jgi:hypothetical protein
MVIAAAAEGSSLGDDLIVALFTAIAGAAVLAIIGYRVAYYWDDRKRIRESDLAALAAFYRLYGEFFATWKLWDSHKRYDVNTTNLDAVQWELLARAEATEGGFEALLVKLASERRLGNCDPELVACFREAYQMLRERIRSDEPLEWWASRDPSDHGLGYTQYEAFKALAGYPASTLEASRPARTDRPTEQETIQALLKITNSAKYRHCWWVVANAKLITQSSEGSRVA